MVQLTFNECVGSNGDDAQKLVNSDAYMLLTLGLAAYCTIKHNIMLILSSGVIRIFQI